MTRIGMLARAALCAALLAAMAPAASHAQTYLIFEPFEGAAWPPTNWLANGIERINTPPGPARSPTHSFRIDSRSDNMRTPILATPGTFDFWFQLADITQTVTVEYSTTGVAPWTNVPGSPFSAVTPNNWTLGTSDLSSQAGIYLRFRLTSTTMDYTVYIDDVSVTTSGAVETPTPTPTPSGSAAGLFAADTVSGNNIIQDSSTFPAGVVHSLLEVVSGPAKGDRFFITESTSMVLKCDTGLLDSYDKSVAPPIPPTSLEAAGVRTGDTCAILAVDQFASGQCIVTGAETLFVPGGTTTWATDTFLNFYVYLEGYVGTTFVPVLCTIKSNTQDSFNVTPSALPEYSGLVNYLIVTNPSPVQTTPLLFLETDSYPDPLCSVCVRRGINFTLVPLQTSTGWNPLNQVDPYVAVLLPTGQFYFFYNGGWHAKTKPVYRGFVIGQEFSDTLGVFLMGPTLPSGKYTVYGVLNTPGASVWDQRFWRSNLASASFFFPLGGASHLRRDSRPAPPPRRGEGPVRAQLNRG